MLIFVWMEFKCKKIWSKNLKTTIQHRERHVLTHLSVAMWHIQYQGETLPPPWY